MTKLKKRMEDRINKLWGDKLMPEIRQILFMREYDGRTPTIGNILEAIEPKVKKIILKEIQAVKDQERKDCKMRMDAINKGFESVLNKEIQAVKDEEKFLVKAWKAEQNEIFISRIQEALKKKEDEIIEKIKDFYEVIEEKDSNAEINRK